MKYVSTLVLLCALSISLHAQTIERVLVKVNGDIFTQTELEERQTAAIRARMGVDFKPDMVNNNEELKKALDEVTPQLLVDAIDELLLLQMGKEKGYHLSDEQFKGWLDNLRKEQNLTDDQKFQAALKQEGMSIEDLRKNVEKQFLVSQVQRDEVGSKLSITEEEARQYYLTHKNEFAEPATVTLREILIEVPSTTKGGQASISVAAQDDAEAEGGGDSRASARGRGLRQGRRRVVGFSVQGQRRPDRPDQPRRGVGGGAGADCQDEAGRDLDADSHESRLSRF